MRVMPHLGVCLKQVLFMGVACEWGDNVCMRSI